MVNLRERLESKHMKPSDLAKETGYSKRYINAILAGDRKPTPDTAKKLAAHSKRAFKWTDFYE
jgi:transcriptional regulator with XRE-family HTH domain